MSDFCRGCSEEHFGKDFGELAGLCAPGECASTLCEGCGYILVDHLGVKIAEAGPRPATAQYYQFATFPFPAQGDEVAEDDTL